VLNADDPRVAAMAALTEARIVTFSRNPAATITAEDIRPVAGAPEFSLRTPSGTALVRLRLLGPHQVQNALAAAAAAWSLEVPLDLIADSLSQAVPRSVSRLAATTRSTDGITVIDDAYNAFPEAMEVALRATAGLAAPTADRPARRTIAVLGEMVAQGQETVAHHERVGELLAELDFAALIAVDGPDLPFYGGAGPAAMARAASTARPTMQVRRAAGPRRGARPRPGAGAAG
jgi:UDP-N-acetylmuramoyl-tripeptide--D-alanyl-D-alanine ligase